MRKISSSLFRGLKYLGLIVLGSFFLFKVRSLLLLEYLDFNSLKENLDFFSIALSVLFYFVSHALRSLRLYSLVDNQRLSFSKIVKFQFLANAVNLLVPFKLGEAYRLFAFSKVLESSSLSLSTLIIERTLDILTLTFIASLGLVLSHSVSASDIDYLYYPLLLICATVLILAVLGPSLLLLMNRRIVAKNNPKLKGILSFVNHLLRSYFSISTLLTKRLLFFITITFLIWFFELFVLVTFLKNISSELDLLLLLTAFIALSSLLPNGPLGVGGINLAFLFIFNFYSIELDASLTAYSYGIIIFGSAILFALILLFLNKKHKINEE